MSGLVVGRAWGWYLAVLKGRHTSAYSGSSSERAQMSSRVVGMGSDSKFAVMVLGLSCCGLLSDVYQCDLGSLFDAP